MSNTAVVRSERLNVPAGGTRTIAANSTTPHTATTGCSHQCRAISQALEEATRCTQTALQRDRDCSWIYRVVESPCNGPAGVDGQFVRLSTLQETDTSARVIGFS